MITMDTLLSHTHDYLARIDRLTQGDRTGLADCLRDHNRLYYVEQSPVISDIEYDRLFAALVRLEECYGEALDSPTRGIRVLLSEQFAKGLHDTAMISLDNTYSVDDLAAFETRVRRLLGRDTGDIAYAAEPKFDGLGANLRYEGAHLVRALTRGNGVEGENITINALQIANIPKHIPYLGVIEVRGEVILPRSEFERINRERQAAGERLFANARNAASGSLRQLDYTVTRSRNLQFFAYSVPLLEQAEGREAVSRATGTEVRTYADYVRTITQLGFASTEPFLYLAGSLADLTAYIEREHRDNSHSRLDFDTDGLVVKLSDLSAWELAGTTEHHPRYAIAYKFPAAHVRTRVVDIFASVGRSGPVTPVAILDAVAIGGVIVRRATLHNYDELEKKDIRIGDHVFIMRAGEVIPEVVASIPETRDGSERIVSAPTHCTACGTALARDAGKVAVFCPNATACPAQIQGMLETFVSKYGLNIEGLGKKTLAEFRRLGYITDAASIFDLSSHSEALRSLDGFDTLSVDNLLRAIEERRSPPLQSLLYGLGIPQVGRKTARILAEYLATRQTPSETLLDTMTSLTTQELEVLGDIGPVSAESIVAFYRESRDILVRLLERIHPVLPGGSASSIAIGSPISGKTFCITGSFDGYTRDGLVALGEAHGGIYRGSVSANLDYLLAGESAGSKLEKAHSLGVTVLSIVDFMGMMGE